MKITAKAAKDFSLALNCRDTVNVKKGDEVEVNLSSAQGMVDAGQIKEPKNFAKMLEGSMETKSAGDEGSGSKPVNLSKMNKAELEAHGKEVYDVDLDKTKSKSDMIAELEALANPEPEDGEDNTDA